MSDYELKKKMISIITEANEKAVDDGNGYRPWREYIADALIAAGIGDAKEYKHRAEVAERALGEFAEHIRCINCPFFERCESSPDSMVYYSTDECFNVYLREAEKELAGEKQEP